MNNEFCILTGAAKPDRKMYSRANSHLKFPKEMQALMIVHHMPVKHATAFQIPEAKYISEMSYAYGSCYLYSAPHSSHLPSSVTT